MAKDPLLPYVAPTHDGADPDDPTTLTKFCEYLATKPGARALRIRRAIARLWNDYTELKADKQRLREALEELVTTSSNANHIALAAARNKARTTLHLTADRPVLPAINPSTPQAG